MKKWMWIACVLSSQAWADGRAELERMANGTASLSANFAQQVFDADGEALDQSTGKVMLARPDRFRWEYLTPEPQQIVADGEHVWIYDIDLEQVSVRPQSFDETRSPLAVLLDLSVMDEQFNVAEQGERDGAQWLRLTPKTTDAEFASVDLGMRDGLLVRMVIADVVGQRTQIVFQDWQRNPTLPAGTFAFQPPPGVDVVGEFRPEPKLQPIAD